MDALQELLVRSTSRHSHLCPRQVLGVRMALAGSALLGMELPRRDKSMIVISETDGCFLDGLEVATEVTPGHRTLRIMDYGKIAATFVNVKTGEAVRLAPRANVRQEAFRYAPEEKRHYFAQLKGYQLMPDDVLFSTVWVTLTPSAEVIMSKPGLRTECSVCGEEIINEREVIIDGNIYCRSCGGHSYYLQKHEKVEILLVKEHLLV